MAYGMIFMLSIILSLPQMLLAQNAQWARSVGDSTGNTRIAALGRGGQTEVLIAGSFDDRQLVLGSETLRNAGMEDAFVAVADETGNMLWAMGIGGRNEDHASAIAEDRDGNMYFAVNFKSLSLDIGPTTLSNRGDYDAALVKINPGREVEWVWHLGNPGQDEITALVVDNRNDVYVAGHTIVTQGLRESTLFVVKMDAERNILWKGEAKGTSSELTSMAVDEQGHCWLGGWLRGNLIFDDEHELESWTDQHGFIAGYDIEGRYQRGRTISHYSSVNVLRTFKTALYVAGEKRNYYMGWGWPLMDSKILLTKFNETLDSLWHSTAGGATEMQSLDIVTGMDCDATGSVYLTGYFQSEGIAFANDSLENIQQKEYFYRQVFLLKYDSAGNQVWGRAAGGDLNDQGNTILTLGENRILLGGMFESGRIEFGDDALVNNGSTREVYVHLRTPRLARNTIAFLAFFEPAVANVIRLEHPVQHALYPQPANDLLHLYLGDESRRGGVLQLYTVDGRLLHTRALPAGRKDFTLATHMLQPGMYLLALTVDGHTEVLRFVRNR